MRAVYKVIGFIGTILSIIVAVACVAGAVVMMEAGIYTSSEENYRSDTFESIVTDMGYNWIDILGNGDEDYVLSELPRKNVAKIVITVDEEKTPAWEYDSKQEVRPEGYTRQFYYGVYKLKDGDTMEWIFYDEEEVYAMRDCELLRTGKIEMQISLPQEFTQYDKLYFADKAITAAYTMRYYVFVDGGVALLLAIIGFVFLMYASGRKRGKTEVLPGWGTKVPFDVVTAGLVFCGVLYIACLDGMPYWWSNDIVVVVAAIVGGIGLCVLLLGWFMSLAVRIKLKSLWKNTLVYFILHWIGIGIRKVFGLFRKVPLVWKTALLFVGISTAEFIGIMCTFWETDNELILWFLEKFFLFPAVLYIALALRKLKKGGETLAAGDLNARVTTDGLIWDFKEHAQNLNQISDGMTVAVEERMKSERMKTELITNVSHDIKTPLTSIINYTDLIVKEPCDNAKIHEYAEVLHRHSERLKRLIEDLVEASKASTGNLEVNLAPCEVGVLLSQSVGEYGNRLEAAGLNLIVSQPEKPVVIQADGRRLWRVFDNLLGNICKYAQSGTRVYLTLEVVDEKALISFKNTSREALNISAEELMERFVQGDNSRKSDGNGLGLSIARSLTELQKGRMDLKVDGDLFKVVLCFPYCKSLNEKLK